MITASVWERDLDTPAPPAFVCELPDSFGRSWRRQISDTGTGQLSVQMDDPARDELTDGRIVRFYRDGDHTSGTLEFAFLIVAQDRALVAPGEEHDEISTVAGPGMLALLTEAVVVPDRTLDIASHTNVKRYDHSSNAYDPDAPNDGTTWDLAVETPQDGNFGPPAPWKTQAFGQWIWSEDSSGTVAAGDCYFINRFTLDENTLVAIEVAYDDIGWIAVDNEIIDGLIQEEFYTGQGRSVQIPLKDGTHIIAAKVTNLNVAKAGLKLAAYEVIDGVLGTLLFESDDTWKALGYPDYPPGFPAGETLREEFASGYLRGCFPDVGVAFTDTEDSDDELFTITSDVTLPIGADLLEVIMQMAVTYVDVDMTPALGLNVWNKGTMGSPSGLELTIGEDIIEYRVIAAPGKRTNALLVRFASGYKFVTDPDLITAHGRCEGFLDLGAIQSAAEATRLAKAEIAERNTQKWTISASVDIPFADRPGLGDTLTGFDFDGNEVTLRVVAETVVSGDDLDDDVWTPELVFVEDP